MGLSARRGAFTLLELMVVIALMAILGAGLGIALARGGGVPLRSAETSLARLFHAARAQAVLMQTTARVIVADTPDAPARHLRLVGLVYRDPENPALWRAANDGVLLPEGVFFRASATEAAAGQMNLAFPLAGSVAEGGGENWYFFEFDARGRLLQPGFVAVASGRLEAGEVVFADTPEGGFIAAATGAILFPGQ